MEKKNKYSNWVLAFLFAVGIIIIYKTVDNFTFVFEFFRKVISSISPFIAGFIIAYLLNLPIVRMRNLLKRTKNKFVINHSLGLSILAVYVLVLVIISVLLRMVIPAIYTNIMDLYYSLPYYFELMIEGLAKIQQKFDLTLPEIDTQTLIARMQGIIKNLPLSEIGKYAQGVISATSSVISMFVAIVVSGYMLFDKERIGELIKRAMICFMPEHHVERSLSYIARINDIFSKYIFSVVLDGIAIGVLSTIFMSLMGVKYALILGVMIGVFNLIPYFGAITAIALSIIVTILTGGWLKGLWTAVMLIILQQIDGNFIGPRIMGNMLEARPLLIIFAVTLGGGLFGIWGMVISVPIAMVIKMIVGDYISMRENRKKG